MRVAWKAHRALYRWSGGRLGLQEYSSSPEKEGLAELTTTGRRSGEPRSVMIGYFEDGDAYITMAMNGWDAADPAWWLNLQANERARLMLRSGAVEVIGRAAEPGEEHDRLWSRQRSIDHNVDKFAERRTEGTAVVILSPVVGSVEEVDGDPGR